MGWDGRRRCEGDTREAWGLVGSVGGWCGRKPGRQTGQQRKACHSASCEGRHGVGATCRAGSSRHRPPTPCPPTLPPTCLPHQSGPWRAARCAWTPPESQSCRETAVGEGGAGGSVRQAGGRAAAAHRLWQAVCAVDAKGGQAEQGRQARLGRQGWAGVPAPHLRRSAWAAAWRACCSRRSRSRASCRQKGAIARQGVQAGSEEGQVKTRGQGWQG